MSGAARAEFLEAYAERFGFSVSEIVEFSDALREGVGATAAHFMIKEPSVHRCFDGLAVAQNALEKAKLQPAS